MPIFKIPLQIVFVSLLYSEKAFVVIKLIQYVLVPLTMARWFPITQYVVFYPYLLAVGGGTRDMCAGIVRQDYTGAHIHAHG